MHKGYAIYEDKVGSIGVRKGDRVAPLMRQTEQRWVPMTSSDMFLFKEEGNFNEAVLDLLDDLKYENSWLDLNKKI